MTVIKYLGTARLPVPISAYIQPYPDPISCGGSIVYCADCPVRSGKRRLVVFSVVALHTREVAGSKPAAPIDKTAARRRNWCSRLCSSIFFWAVLADQSAWRPVSTRQVRQGASHRLVVDQCPYGESHYHQKADQLGHGEPANDQHGCHVAETVDVGIPQAQESA